LIATIAWLDTTAREKVKEEGSEMARVSCVERTAAYVKAIICFAVARIWPRKVHNWTRILFAVCAKYIDLEQVPNQW